MASQAPSTATITAHATERVPAEHRADDVIVQEDIVRSRNARIALAISRLFIGFTFLWPFLDKTFGLGFATKPERAWIRGGTPAQGFMNHAEGPFAGLFKAMANPFADWLFMIGLLCIGVAVLCGCGLRIAAVAGSLLLFMMWLAEFPPVLGGNNPFLDSHWLEAIMLITAAATLSGDTLGLGKTWARMIKGRRWLR